MGFRFSVCGMSESKEKRWFVEAIHQKISWSRYEIKQKDDIFRYAPPLSPSATSPYNRETTPSSPSSSSSGTRISPSVLFIIVILAVLFFISGLLHLLVRFLVKRSSSSGESQSNRYPEISGSDALQRQLQQLFHLHDSGLDQAFIDALPVFQYREIMGLKEPFDCAVCLCEFSEKDKLRLLPMCSHAFHINCIDTWLLSNSTCPLCRGTLFTSGFPMESPMLDLYDFREDEGFPVNGETGMNSNPKTVEIEEIVAEKGVLPVRLGKFRKLNDGTGEAGGETSSSNLDARRCFSMGSFQYVVGNSGLRVAFSNDRRVRDVKLPRDTEQNGDLSTGGDLEGKRISRMAKGESFSASKIWLWSKKGKFSTASDANNSIHSSLNVDLPRMARAQDK